MSYAQECDRRDAPAYPDLLRRLVTTQRFPALAAALQAGVFDGPDDGRSDFRSGLHGFLDGIAARVGAPR